ncbi:hypothetical protein MWU76_19700 [Gelidibacter sp. F2691]|nr:hypothetical protein [Gelidibacter sp. F2691]
MHTESHTAALGALIILQLTMLMALLFKIPPHPPEVIPFGGMAPVIGASLCAAFAALVFRGEGRSGKALVICACLLAAISYGPQKYFDPAFNLVWPAVITAQIAIIALIVPIVRQAFARQSA